MEKKLLTIQEASEMLGVVTTTLRRWSRDGKIKSIRTAGNHRRYKLEDVKAMMEEKTE